MDIIFYCPHCDQKIQAPSPYAGKNILCPNCRAEIIVPFTSSENTNIQLETEKEDKNASISEAKIEESDLNSVQKIQSSQNSNKESAPFNEVVYTLLGIFFGLFGTHNFYKRQYIAGSIRIAVIIVSIIISLLPNSKYRAAVREFAQTTLTKQELFEKKERSLAQNDIENYKVFSNRYQQESEKLQKNIEEMEEARENMLSIFIFIILLQFISFLLVITELGFQRKHTSK